MVQSAAIHCTARCCIVVCYYLTPLIVLCFVVLRSLPVLLACWLAGAGEGLRLRTSEPKPFMRELLLPLVLMHPDQVAIHPPTLALPTLAWKCAAVVIGRLLPLTLLLQETTLEEFCSSIYMIKI